MRISVFGLRRVLTLLWAAALLLSSAPPAGAAENTDLDLLVKAVRKHTSTTQKPGKALCVCMSDSLAVGTKRMGFLDGGSFMISNTQFAAVRCRLLPYDLNGNYVPGPPSTCTDWVPLGD